MAIERGDDRDVERLLVSGAHPNFTPYRDYLGLPPLAWASAQGSTKIVELLIDHGANVNGANQYGTTPLHVAAFRQDEPMAALLLRRGALVEARNDAGFTPLLKAMERLAFAPATQSPTREEVAKATGVVKLLLASGPRIEARESGVTAINLAAMTGQGPLVQLLLDEGVGVDARTAEAGTPLYQAAKRDAVETARLLIARGADVNARTVSGFTPLTMTAEHGSDRVAKVLLAHHADADARHKDGSSPLLSACRSLLIHYTLEGPTLAAKDLRYRMLLGDAEESRAALREDKGSFHAVAVLLTEHGADPNVAAHGFTPLSAAATVGDLELVRTLLARGAAIDDTSVGEAALHAAIAERHADVANLLIAHGANVNARNIHKRTPLHFLGAFIHDRELAELLIRRGADVNAKDKRDETPLAFATRARNHNVAAVLRQHGAR